MNEFTSPVVTIVALWIVIWGVAYMGGGSAAARAVFVRPVRWAVPQLFRFTRWTVGGSLIILGRMAIALGEWIRG